MKPNKSIKVWTLAALAVTGSLSAPGQTNRVDPKSFEAFKLVVERNIFDSNRRPPPPPGTPRVRTVVDSFSLTGTMSYDTGTFAVFDGNNADYHKVLKLEDKIAGFTVTEITHDSVKLVSGTNEMQLKVGMQMRRSQEGRWSAGQAAESSFAYDSGSRARNTGRDERFSRNGRNRFNMFGGANNSREASRTSGGYGSSQAQGFVTRESAPAMTGSNPNDVVARMMAARAAQMGQDPNQNDGNSQFGNQNAQGGDTNFQPDILQENPTPETPVPNQQFVPNEIPNEVPNSDPNQAGIPDRIR